MKKEKENVSGSEAGDLGGGDFMPPGTKDIKDVIENPFAIPLLSAYLGGEAVKDAVITDCSIDNSGFGEFALISLQNDGATSTYRCNSDAVIDQVKKLVARRDMLPVLAHIARRKNKSGKEYFSLLG